jgi:hypothetical protein
MIMGFCGTPLPASMGDSVSMLSANSANSSAKLANSESTHSCKKMTRDDPMIQQQGVVFCISTPQRMEIKTNDSL